MAPKLGVFVVPNEMCHSPSKLTNDMDKTVALVEQEVCFDSSKAKLSDYQVSNIDNPLHDLLNINLSALIAQYITTSKSDKVTEEVKQSEWVKRGKQVQQEIDDLFKEDIDNIYEEMTKKYKAGEIKKLPEKQKIDVKVTQEHIVKLRKLEQEKIECIEKILKEYPLPIPEPVKVKEPKTEKLKRLAKRGTENMKSLVASKSRVSHHTSTPRTGKPSQGNAPERI